MLLSLLATAIAAATIRDLSLPFPRPSPTQAIAQLAQAAERQNGEPEDMIDAYGGRSEWLTQFESEVADYLGMEAALFCPTGVAAQNAALAVHAELPFREYRTQPSPCFVMHETSHLWRYEEMAFTDLLGLTALLAGDAERVLTAADVAFHLKRLAAIGSAPCMILVELPHRELGCATVAWNELLELRRLADEYNVPLHLDGARLWEIAPYYASDEGGGVSLHELVALFDTAYVSFYKGADPAARACSGAMDTKPCHGE